MKIGFAERTSDDISDAELKLIENDFEPLGVLISTSNGILPTLEKGGDWSDGADSIWIRRSG
jgi:hypothetical protein